MKVPFFFSILRYIHDPVTQEFINIGVALYSPKAKYVAALCTSRYKRIADAFKPVDRSHFRRQTDYIQSRIDEFGEKLAGELPFQKMPKDLDEILRSILPPDDSSFQFGPAGSGLSGDLEKTLDDLYERYVNKYYQTAERKSRNEDEVWITFRKPLQEKNVLWHLKAHTIVSRGDEYEFEYAWKNEVWHTLQPLSLDLVESGSVIDKAHTWLGRAESLKSGEKFKLHFLLGLPTDPKMRAIAEKAQNIIHKTSVPHEFHKEDEAADFAEDLRKKIETHE
jgi:hypothetical protein